MWKTYVGEIIVGRRWGTATWKNTIIYKDIKLSKSTSVCGHDG